MTIQEDPAASYKLFAAAFKKRGYSVKVEGGAGAPTIVTYTSPRGKEWKVRAAHIAYPFNSPEVIAIAADKDVSYRLAESAGVPIPATLLVTENTLEGELLGILKKFGRLIVKPADSLQSRGLTTGIATADELEKAIAHAKETSPRVLVQQQVEGEEIRFTVIGGKVEAALLRQTARVIGDGVSSVAQLISRENKERQALKFAYLAYPQLDEALVDKALLASGDVPKRGEIVELNRSTMVRGGCSVYDVLPRVDKSYVAMAEMLAARMRAGLLVVDMFCQDFTQPAAPGNHYFIECNTTPALRLYYACRDGRHFAIVERLTEEIDRWLHSRRD